MNRLLLCVLTLLLVFPLTASATLLTFDYNIEFSGATSPEGTAPWLTATFDDSFGGSDTVRLTMSAGGLVDNEFVGWWYFNFDPTLNPINLSVANVDITDVVSHEVSFGVDAYKADGDGNYDILIGNFGDKFTAGESVVLDFTYVNPITVAAFDFLSAPAGGHGPFKSAAHVQGIGPGDALSGWVAPDNGSPEPAPEPATLLLLGTGLIGFAAGFRKKFKK